MNRYSISYNLKWRVKFAHNYKFTECGKLINTKTCRVLKKSMIGYSIGYTVKGKFYILDKLRQHLEIIPKEKTPF